MRFILAARKQKSPAWGLELEQSAEAPLGAATKICRKASPPYEPARASEST